MYVLRVSQVERDHWMLFLCSGAHFLKDPETFRAHKAIFSLSVSNSGKAYTPETSCIRGTSVHFKNR